MLRLFVKSLWRPYINHVNPSRRYNHNAVFYTVPFQFTKEIATKKFAERNKGRIFAPIVRKEEKALQLSNEKNLIKKEIVPCTLVQGTTKNITFTGEYGVTSVTYITINKTITPLYYTNWYKVHGTLSPRKYYCDDPGMLIYSGLKLSSDLVETAISGDKFTKKLIPFDPKDINSDIEVDPFYKRVAMIKEIIHKRFVDTETERAKQYIRQQYGHNDVNVRVNLEFEFTMFYALLPVYILQYENQAPFIMSGIDVNKDIIGSYQLSTTKVMVVGAVASTALTFIFPAVAISMRLLMIFISTFGSGIWSFDRTNAFYRKHLRKIKEETNANNAFPESYDDIDRMRRTENIHAYAHTYKSDEKLHSDVKEKKLLVDEKYFIELGIDSNTTSLTEKDILQHIKLNFLYITQILVEKKHLMKKQEKY